MADTDALLAAELAAMRDREQQATPSPWYNEPNTGAGRVWVQIGRKHFAPADCEPLFNVRRSGAHSPEDQQREYRQREADAAFIVHARTDLPRLLRLAGAVLALADHWHDTQGTPYSARAQCAQDLRDLVNRELLGKRGSDAQD